MIPGAAAPRVRRGVPADLERVAELAAESLPEAGSAEDLAATSASPSAELWVGCCESRPEGSPAEGFLLVLRVGPEVEILWLAVAPSARRRGLARRLVGSALEGAEVCHLEVRSGRSAARAFYESEGFVAVGRRSAYHPGGEDAIRMRWTTEGVPRG